MRSDIAASKGTALRFDRLYMRLPVPVAEDIAQMAAESAVAYARFRAPKLSGVSARRLQPIWSTTHFGIRWIDSHIWFQEMGIRPFVMSNLQGKTVPMWVEDRDGSIKRKNPRVQTRVTADGRHQVLIFRKAAKKGERKMVKRRIGSMDQYVSVPASYPGAPGRINRRRPGAPLSRIGGGQINTGNVGVRWRHPGMAAKFFLHEGILIAGREFGFPLSQIEVAVQGEVI